MGDQVSVQTSPQNPQPPEPAPQATANIPEEDEKIFATIGYLAFLFIIPLIVKPKSDYCKFHAKQSMVMFLIAIVVLVFLAAIPWFGSLLTLALFALYVLAIYRAYKGEQWNIPVVSQFAQKLDIEALYGKAGLAVSGISSLKEKATDLAEKTAEQVKALGKQEEKPEAKETTPQPKNP